MSLEKLDGWLPSPPLYSVSGPHPTLYTAVYRPAKGRVDYIWPGKTLVQRFEDFQTGDTRTPSPIDFPVSERAHGPCARCTRPIRFNPPREDLLALFL